MRRIAPDPNRPQFSACAIKGIVSPQVAAVVFGRDFALLAGAFLHRAYILNWKWTSWSEYFRVKPSAAGDSGEKEDAAVAPAAPVVQPILLSKVATGLQIILVGAALSHAAYQWPPPEWIALLGGSTATCTAASG